MQEAFAYVDPGSGYTFLQGSSFLWGWAVVLFMAFLIPLRFFLRKIKKNFLFFFGILILLLIICAITFLIMHRKPLGKKVIILAIDAMDSNITQRLLAEGKLPNFSRLKEEGGYSELATTNPAESAVAWTTFFTGLNPGGHGIFDFVMRNPKDNSLYLSLNEAARKGNSLKIKIRHKGSPFWEILSKHKIPSSIYFCPNTYPAPKIYGKIISGMGVPDITGLIGKYTFYTTRPLNAEDKDSRGRIIFLKVQDSVILTAIYGPKADTKAVVSELSIPLKITRDKENVILEYQKRRLSLDVGKWSDWQEVYFKIGLFKKISGIVRFYLKSAYPDLELYASPINFSPRNVFVPLSYPRNLSARIADKVGLFYTQGMPHDTWPLTEERLGEKEFLEHTDIILNERKKILSSEFKNFQEGVFFFYFDTLDAVQHMFWRYSDEKSPLYEKDSAYKDTIYSYYQKIDEILGEISGFIDEDTVLFVISDHGFGPFRKSVHLNRWLLENGFLYLKEGLKEGRELLADIDWQKTRAYALGFGGIYLNLSEREKSGIVSKIEREAIKKEIREKLLSLQDNGEGVVKNIYMKEEIFLGNCIDDAPDLFVGFNSGYRASWQTALGGVPQALMEDNLKKWSGDHLVDPSLVPGVIFVNKKVKFGKPYIADIAPTILGLFGISKPNDMPGEELF